MRLNGTDVVAATIHEPLEGRWWADVVTPGGTHAGLVTLEIGNVSWVGTVVESAPDGGRNHVRLVGGHNGLATEVPDRWYRGTNTLQAIAADLLGAVGEQLDLTSPQLTRALPSWQRFFGPAIEALTDLTHAQRLAWRITRAGTVRLLSLPHAFPAAADPALVIGDDGRAAEIAVDTPELEPGVTVLGHAVHRITWEATPERLTGLLHYTDAPTARAVQDHRSIAEAGIDSQRSDGSLDVIAASRYGLTEVPLYNGLPGVQARVAPGAQTLVAYAGSPRRPLAVAHRGGPSGCKIGSLVLVTAIVSGVTVVVSGQWFGADEISEAAAQLAGAPPNQLIPIVMTDAVQQ